MIDPNPYQKRIASNREKVVGIAMSIASDKMLQTPTGRWVGKRFQSAIGHTRTESYRLNAEIQAGLAKRYDSNGNGYPKDITLEHIEAVKAAVTAGRDFAVMPWVVDELTDEQMYRYATIENNQREDLSPIEKMEEMKGWVAFGYNSKQIAQLYPGMSDATVRGLLYFDQLPKEAKTALHEGKISQGTARTLLSMQRVAPAEKVAAVIKKIEKQEGNALPDKVIEEALDHLGTAVDMWDSNRQDGKPRSAWKNGWLLDMKNFPNKLLPELTVEEMANALDIKGDNKAIAAANGWYFFRMGRTNQTEEEWRAVVSSDVISKIDHLINPPACTACPFYTKVRGSHYCGMKPCHTRKTAAWHTNQTEQASKNLGIGIYDKSDGGYRVLDSYNHRALFNSKHKGLRLLPRETHNGRVYQYFDGIDDDVAVVVATGEAIKKMSGKGKSGGGGGKLTEKEKAERRAMRLYRQRRRELLWEYTGVAQSLFEGVPIETLRKIGSWHFIGIDDRIPDEHDHPQTGTPAEKLEFQRRELIWKLVVGETSHYTRSDLATLLDRFYKITQVKTPKALLKRVQEWDLEIHDLARVSTATPDQKKGKKA